ncbi:MAG: hypothetical protein ACD_17C00173G0005, partial [uncultured bacterium]
MKVAVKVADFVPKDLSIAINH